MPVEPPLSSGPRDSPKPWWAWVAAALVLVVLVVYPPFRVGSRQGNTRSAAASAAAGFQPAAFAEDFWREQLQPAADRAPDLSPVLAALQRDPVSAATAHARQVGLGHAAYYFLRGSGRITAVERSRVLVEIGGASIAVRSGPVFGNGVRDGSGLLDVNEVPGLADFNALSAELNRIVEERIQPALQSQAAVGATLRFAGMAEAPEMLPIGGGPLLTFVPVQAEVIP